ncbi:hypothetical protein JQU17_08435 [Ponticoccus sp. SC2-23]|uniref:hypothetical protein n=1 Tax=Alexandriicola marinus TaxID=2081710 RepID=UPI000FDC474E|nr:hypothetical protein [Alexandriicola marinus]MBM1220287.1 hypothetical protein [Ponticoccus sp. SC6-9]MBM1224973.1 hypothetical protein [Ponticoccus sp. SC6-15]MBM1228487.1 hypothetical protein [Ponticoccus sp. SC6-38]MBM1233876.1 hypothetical protein [Ponticoccus sp. SC6-45]MBM1238988.1 hypothetical protein [Ponticoccus sp. SC6-49]MBM1242770.1 hypothetical protein [Ponticoccus sp. SC2-64]MBM1247400.1 hypothetical protein [Ponticoccus sp. SC6-42]MBM1251941.1 hypothetical protein [Pontico
MTTMISIARISEVPTPDRIAQWEAEHREIFGAYAEVPRILRDPNDPNQVAILGKVHDLDGLRAASRTPEGDAHMRRYGFLEQLSYFLEDA